MAILVTKKWSTPKLNVTSGGATLTESYDVTGVSDVKAALDAMYATYPETRYNYPSPLSQYLFASTQNSSVAGFGMFNIEVTWSSNNSGTVDPTNPLNEPTKYRLEWQNTTESSSRDAFGNPILNGAFQPFATDPSAEIVTGLLTAERNEPFYDAKRAVEYANAIANTNVTFHGIWPFEKGQACSRKISCLTPINGHEKYVTIQYQIELRGGFKKDDDGYWDGFKLRIMNTGTRGWYHKTPAGTGSAMGRIVAPAGVNLYTPITEPVLLNRFGKPYDTQLKIAGLDGPHDPIEAPLPLPATTAIEEVGGVTWLKVFPDGYKLKNLNDLGL